MPTMKVAVIGAGPSGLCAARQLSLSPDHFQIVGYEINRGVGGLWNYSDHTDVNEYGLPCLSSMYKSLRVNLPTAVMRFPDEAFHGGTHSFPGWAEVKRYLDNYANKYDLNKYFKFQTFVTGVKPCTSEGGVTWLVTSRNLRTNEVSTESFDVIMVANGTEGKPHIPNFPGADKFRGTIVHTKNHRDNEVYRGKTVLVVGASYSVQDMIFEVGPVSKKMYVAHRSKEPLSFAVPDNVFECPTIKEIVPNGVILTNGEVREVDGIILGTGFEYTFPFLAPECKLKVKDERIQPLYMHMVNIEYPRLWFIGLIKGVLEFQVAFAQAHYACAVLRGEVKLPPQAEMYRQEEEEYQKRVVEKGLHPKFIHDLFGPPLRPYIDVMAEHTKYRPITLGSLNLFDRFCDVITYEYGTLKQRTYALVGDDDFTESM